jgi:hypothetical protein
VSVRFTSRVIVMRCCCGTYKCSLEKTHKGNGKNGCAHGRHARFSSGQRSYGERKEVRRKKV